MGSSPHARGAHPGRWRVRPLLGIIPACAGSTPGRHTALRLCQDHPRMRGEHFAWTIQEQEGGGSSPHARGALWRLDPTRPMQGIIPACAGSTIIHRRSPLPLWDHPRMRGEHLVCHPQQHYLQGSSPHARGALSLNRPQTHTPGIIPACAGSTSGISTACASSRDHPRMRGEHADGSRYCPNCGGSSPHARGALSHDHLYLF